MKHIRKILTVLLIAMLFISCNSDMTGMGIFNTIKHSKPNTSFKLRKLSGALDNERFLIETDEGLDIYDVTDANNGNKTPLIKGLSVQLMFTTEISGTNYIVYTTNEKDNVTYIAKVNGDFESISDSKEITFMAGSDIKITNLVKSFFENDQYVLLATDEAGNYYFITVSLKQTDAPDSIKDTFDEKNNAYTFNKFSAVTDKATSPDYLGNGYYYVEHHEDSEHFFNIYRTEGNTPIVFSDKSQLKALPFAVENDYVFASDSLIYRINPDNTLTQVSDSKNKHSLIYLNRNQEAPMVTVDDVVYGIANAKPFTWDGKTFTEYSYIADIHIIDMYYKNGTFYAFSDSNGVYKSTNGTEY